MTNELREKLAGGQHEIWSHWMKYLFSKCDNGVPQSLSYLDNDSLIIPGESVRHWQRQMNTPYSELTEKEKESDREQADKVLKVLGEYKRTFLIP